jgi:hydrogenase nickel incorporation protein HypA/HybF
VEKVGEFMDIERVITDLLREIENMASINNAIEVINVKIKLGALTDLMPDDFKDQFTEAAGGTIADGANVEVELSDGIDDPDAQTAVLEDVALV